jgi:hypothetical protein
MAASLDKAKKILKDRYLGQAGIHGVGLKRSENSVVIYVTTGYKDNPEFQAVLKSIIQDASPFKVVHKEEDLPRI